MTVCRESRAVACKVYTLSFGTQYTPPSVWFSFELDTLHMSCHVIDGFERQEEKATLEKNITDFMRLSIKSLDRHDPLSVIATPYTTIGDLELAFQEENQIPQAESI